MVCVCQSLSRVLLFATSWTVARQALLSVEFSRQEYWSESPFPSQGIFLTQGSNLGLLHFRQILYHLKVKVNEATQSCPTLCDPKNCSVPGSMSYD